MGSLNPIFPLEIFSLIIDELVEDPDSLSEFQRPDTFNAVKRCAIVCRSFAALCQPYIFRVIDDTWLSQDSINTRRKHPIHVMKSNPNLLRYVRHLSIDSYNWKPFTSSRGELDKAIEVLTGFPNLKELDVVIQKVHPMIHQIPQHYRDAFRGLVDAYVSQGTLRSLTISGLENLHADDIFSCSTVRELVLGLIMPSYTISAPHITVFTIQRMEELRLEVLCFLPNLQVLNLWDISSVVPTRGESPPSFDLRVLKLFSEDGGVVTTFLDFYNGYAKTNAVQPFAKLEEFHYFMPYEVDFEAVEKLLGDAKLLKVLIIDTMLAVHGETFPLARLDLSTKILNVFPHLTRLRFDLHVDTPNNYDYLMTEISDIFVNIEGRNVIENVNICIDLDDDTFDSIPSYEPWSRISRSLSSCPAYPSLKVVHTQIVYTQFLLEGHSIYSDPDWAHSFDEQLSYMSYAMDELVERKEVKFFMTLELDKGGHLEDY